MEWLSPVAQQRRQSRWRRSWLRPRWRTPAAWGRWGRIGAARGVWRGAAGTPGWGPSTPHTPAPPLPAETPRAGPPAVETCSHQSAVQLATLWCMIQSLCKRRLLYLAYRGIWTCTMRDNLLVHWAGKTFSKLGKENIRNRRRKHKNISNQTLQWKMGKTLEIIKKKMLTNCCLGGSHWCSITTVNFI